MSIFIVERVENDNRIFVYVTVILEQWHELYTNKFRPFTDKSCAVLMEDGKLVLRKSYFVGVKQ